MVLNPARAFKILVCVTQDAGQVAINMFTRIFGDEVKTLPFPAIGMACERTQGLALPTDAEGVVDP